MTAWPSIPIKAIARVVTGNTPPKIEEDNYGGDIPWVKLPELGSTDPITCTSENLSFKGAAKARILPAGAVLVSCIGTIGRVGIAGTDLTTNQQINAVVCGPAIEPRFAMYWFIKSSDELSAAANNAVVPILNKGNFEQIKIPVWPRSEQCRVVEILDEADRMRKLRREADAKTARVLPALFRRMFDDPATNRKKWPLRTGKQLFKVVRYGVGTPPPFTESGIPFLRATNLKPEGVNRKNLVFFDPADAGSIARSKVQYGDIVIVRRGANTGDCVVIPKEFDGAYVGYDLICEPSTNTNSIWFAVAWNYPTIWQTINALRTRAAQQGLNKDQIESFILPTPPKMEQDVFASQAAKLATLLADAKRGAEMQETLFSLLLQRAFSGQLTAKWREVHMKELLVEMQEQAHLLNLPLPKELETTQ